MHPSLMVLPLGAHFFVRASPSPSGTVAVAATGIQFAAFIMLWAVSLSCCRNDVWPAGIVLYGIATSALIFRRFRHAWIPAALLWAWYGYSLFSCDCPITALWATPYGIIFVTILVLAWEQSQSRSAASKDDAPPQKKSRFSTPGGN